MATKIHLGLEQRNLTFLTDQLKQNPSILADYRLESLDESLLHVATKSGHLELVQELMKIDPDLATELDHDGFRPLDIAVIIGNLGIVKEILSCNQDLGLLKGKDQRTALHYAAMKGRISVLDELLHSCPNAIKDVTVDGETALHLAVRYHQFDAFAALVKWLEVLNMEALINVGDEDGNTALHIAVLTRQLACIKLLLAENSAVREATEVNAKNGEGLTPLDLLDHTHDVKIKRKLESNGAIRSPHSSSITVAKSLEHAKHSKHEHLQFQSEESSKDWFKYFKFQRQRDSPSNARSTLLVVAALIATVCFQAGTQPPNGIFDKPKLPNTQTPNSRPSTPPPPQYINPATVSFLSASSGILGSHATSFLFLFANTLGLTASTCIIIYLTSGFPFQTELHIALYSMMFTYGFAIDAIVKDSGKKEKTLAYVLVTIAFTLPFTLRWLPRWGRKGWRRWRKREVRKGILC